MSLFQVPVVDEKFLRDVFNKVDKDRSGRITAFELQQALINDTWKPFNIKTVELMIGMFDTEHTGNITFNDFGALWKFVTDLQSCFRSFDRDDSGSMDRQELSKALTTFGHHFSPQTVRSILAKFGGSGQRIEFDDFIQCFVALDTLKRRFERYDLNRDGVTALKFEQVVEMLMNIKM